MGLFNAILGNASEVTLENAAKALENASSTQLNA